MESLQVREQAQRAFGVALKDLAAAGSAPVVLQDCLRWLALRGLTTPRLFQTPVAGDKRKLLALRHLYDTGRRPLRSKSCRDKDPHLIASLLRLWLGALPEPMFPAELVPALVESQQSDYYEERLSSVRALLKQAEPFVVEALFPLFELFHHYWINQPDRDGTLQELGRLLAPSVFGTAMAHGLPPEDNGLLSDTVEMLISEYRPLFTQPFNLRRFEADAARQAAAEAQRAEAAAAAAAAALAGPILTPIRCERLSVMAPEGASPFSDCCATPLPDSPYSAALMAEACYGSSPPSPGFRFAFAHGLPEGGSFGSPVAGSLASAEAVTPGAVVGLAPGSHSSAVVHPPFASHSLDQHFSDLLESTVSGMLFDVPPTPPRGDGELAFGSSPGRLAGVSASVLSSSDAARGCGEQPMSPVGVVRDGDDSTDNSDCDVPMAGRHTFAWARGAGLSVPC